ncbi:response regulator transcription factor [Aliicoccus persicus]|uniref:Two component transcriptional regulator, LuxR family n=1 Tax=Aliicoccus persicus TaxID=930138 RepID=A0A662Z2D6_9STAP|nr:response regulator transcription factor [Aliicoccus persicus]SEV88492.1 two component transcriptional regulator, LuxR family [Aliicoccus persicus]
MKVIIVDDDSLVISALETIVESAGHDVVATGKDGTEAIELFREHHPDVLMMDIRMKEMNGIEASKKIIEAHGAANILLVTTFKDEEYISEALSLGVKGYLLKDNYKGIVPAINAVASGNMVFDSEIVQSFNKQEIKSNIGFEELTNRELEILELVAEGMSNKEISETLFISEGTVRNYISTMLSKLHLSTRTQLVVMYYKHGK